MVRNCPNCGKPLKEGYVFCGKCGSRIIEEEPFETKNAREYTEQSPKSVVQKKNWTKLGSISAITIIILIILVVIVCNNPQNNDSEIGGTTTVNGNSPSANFNYYISGSKVSFTGVSYDEDGIITRYSWNFGDGTISTEKNPTHKYERTGTYTVTLTVFDDDGYKDTKTKTLTIKSVDSDGDGYSDEVDDYPYDSTRWKKPDIRITYESKSDALEGANKVGYVYITVTNVGGHGEGTVCVTAYQGSEEWTRTQVAYLSEGESETLTFRFAEIHFWTLDPWGYYAWVE